MLLAFRKWTRNNCEAQSWYSSILFHFNQNQFNAIRFFVSSMFFDAIAIQTICAKSAFRQAQTYEWTTWCLPRLLVEALVTALTPTSSFKPPERLFLVLSLFLSLFLPLHWSSKLYTCFPAHHSALAICFHFIILSLRPTGVSDLSHCPTPWHRSRLHW